MPIDSFGIASVRLLSSSDFSTTPLHPSSSLSITDTANMDPFQFNNYPIPASQEPYSQTWYASYPHDSSMQSRPQSVVYSEQQHQHQHQQQQSHHQGQPPSPWMDPTIPPTGAQMWQTPIQQQTMPQHTPSLAPPTRPGMSRNNSLGSEVISSAASLVDESTPNFPYHHHPERSPDPLASNASLRSSGSFSSPPPPSARALEATPGSASSSAGPSEHQHSDTAQKRPRGRPRKIRPEVEPKPPKVSRRQPHNMVERKYREGLNKEMERLRSAIPNLEGAMGSIGSSTNNKASKATVLQSAVEEIETLRKEKQKLFDDLQKAEIDLDETKKARETLERRLRRLEEEVASLRGGYGGGIEGSGSSR